MPIFEYQCSNCEKKFSELRKGLEKDEAIACPECSSSETKRLVTGFAVGSIGGSSSAGACASSASCPSAGGFG